MSAEESASSDGYGDTADYGDLYYKGEYEGSYTTLVDGLFIQQFREDDNDGEEA